MKVGKICSRKVVTIRREDSILEAARRMREEHVGDLVIIEPQETRRTVPLGILTDRDIVVGILAKDLEHLAQLQVGDVIVSELVTATEDEDLDDALRRMRAAGVRRVPVVELYGGLVGILSLDDVFDALATEMNDIAKLVSRQRRMEAQRRPA